MHLTGAAPSAAGFSMERSGTPPSATLPTPQQAPPAGPSSPPSTAGTHKTLWPAQLHQILATRLLSGETPLKLLQRPRVVLHSPACYMLGSRESSAYPDWGISLAQTRSTKNTSGRRRRRRTAMAPGRKRGFGVCTSLPTTPHLVVGRSACRVGVRPSLNRSWAQRSRPVVQAGRRAFPGDESVVD